MRGLTEFRLNLLRKGITQKEIANATKLPTSTVSLIASGKLNPTIQQKRALSEALGLPMKKLFVN